MNLTNLHKHWCNINFPLAECVCDCGVTYMWDLELPFEAELFSIPVQQAFQQEPVQTPKNITVVDYDISLGVVLFVSEEGLFETTSFDKVRALPRVKTAPGFAPTKV